MKEHNRLRIERLTARYEQRIHEKLHPEEAELLREFEQIRERVIRPQMEELAAELRKAGHDSRVVDNSGPDKPNIELSLGLAGGAGSRNVVGFSVIRWKDHPLQILAYLEVNPPAFDLERYTRPADILPERVEQLLVDAVEHVVVCNAP
jgi:hypothetical protein